MAETFQLDAPGIAKIAAQVAAILRADSGLRALQSQNASPARYFDQPGVAGGSPGLGGITGTTPAITGNVVYEIQECKNRQGEIYASLILVFDGASGSGRFRIDGGAPTPTVGKQIPAGGIVVRITGYENIRNFKLIAEAGQTLTFARELFL